MHLCKLVWTVFLMSSVPLVGQESKPTGKMDLYLLIGQSNMAGRGKIDKQSKISHPHVFMLNKQDKWVPAVDPLHFDKPIAGVGPGLAFGKAMAKANPHTIIGLIPCAAGGSPLEVWKKGGYWGQTKSKPYDETLRRVAIARKHGTLRGILWHQGESDSKEKLAVDYGQRLAEMIGRLRKELQASDVPFLVGGMSDPFQARNKHAKTVNAALSNLPKQVKHCAFVSAKGLTLKSDRIHFDTKSERELGQRYAKVMLEQLKGN